MDNPLLGQNIGVPDKALGDPILACSLIFHIIGGKVSYRLPIGEDFYIVDGQAGLVDGRVGDVLEAERDLLPRISAEIRLQLLPAVALRGQAAAEVVAIGIAVPAAQAPIVQNLPLDCGIA